MARAASHKRPNRIGRKWIWLSPTASKTGSKVGSPSRPDYCFWAGLGLGQSNPTQLVEDYLTLPNPTQLVEDYLTLPNPTQLVEDCLTLPNPTQLVEDYLTLG